MRRIGLLALIFALATGLFASSATAQPGGTSMTVEDPTGTESTILATM